MWRETELSSEIEWMVGSGQATPEMLAEALVEYFYAPVYRFSLALLGNGEAATVAFQLALVTAVSQAPRYQQSTSPQVWFFRFVFDAIHNIRSDGLQARAWRSLSGGAQAHLLPEARRLVAAVEQEDRLPAIFYLLLGWKVPEIASILGQKTAEVTSALERAQDGLTREVPPNQDPAESLRIAIPAPNLSAEQMHEIALLAAQQAAQNGRRSLRFIRIREATWLIGAVLLALLIGITWSSSQRALEPLKTPPPLNTPTPVYESSMPASAHSGETLPTTADHRPVLITRESTSAEIRKTLQNSQKNWKNLWVNAQITISKLPMSGDQPFIYNTHILISQPDHYLLTILPEDRDSIQWVLTTKDQANFSSRDRSYSWFTDHPNSTLKGSAIGDLLYPGQSGWFNQPGEFQAAEYASMAGRTAVTINWQSAKEQQTRRLWVDVKTGVILCMQKFLDATGEIDFSEYKIKSIAYDFEVPPQVFNPSFAGGFSTGDSLVKQNERYRESRSISQH